MIPVITKFAPLIHDKKREDKAYTKLRKSIVCAYCSMPASGSCLTCNLPMCKKHQAIENGAMYCREHTAKLSGIVTDAHLDWETDDGPVPEV